MQLNAKTGTTGRVKFIAGGVIILAAVIYLIVSSARVNAEYFVTVDELSDKRETLVGRNLRISGAVVGSTILYNPDTNILSFEVANVPGDNATIDSQGGLAKVLHEAVLDPGRTRMKIEYQGIKPDLLKDEAQAIITGHLTEDGIFSAKEILLKCPTKYQEVVPSQAAAD